MFIRFADTDRYVEARRVGEGDILSARHDLSKDAAGRISDRQYMLAAKELRVKKIDLNCWVEAFRGGGAEQVALVTCSAPPSFAVNGAIFTSIHDALAAPKPGVVRWGDKSHTCVLDVDFHGAAPPPRERLRLLAAIVLPAPVLWWLSKSGGLHLLYERSGIFSGEELAAVAGLAILDDLPTAVFELKADTFLPPFGDRVETRPPNPDVGAVRRLRGAHIATDAEYAAWLADQGLEVGVRYPHDQCPANPSARAMGNSDPVVVHDDHIYCYICAADGITHGSRTAGYFPPGRLCGRQAQSLLDICTEHFTHWEHARHVIASAERRLSEPVARVVYRAALRQRHGDDPRVDLAMTRGQNLVRYDGHWGDAAGRPVVFRKSAPLIIGNLPAAQMPDGSVVGETVEWLTQHLDLTQYGYPAITPVWGVHMTQNFPPPTDRVLTVLPSSGLQSEDMRDRRPRYLPRGARPMAEDAAWSVLDEATPGFSRPLVELLIVAKGCAEDGGGMPPMLFISGPTGSGKTVSAQIAAGICGDSVTVITWSGAVERVRAGLLSAKKSGTFAAFDEFLKLARGGNKEALSAMEQLLSFTSNSESHALYIGPVRLGNLPVCVWCDTAVPIEVLTHEQIGRRLVWAQLPSRRDWRGTLKATGIIDPQLMRAKGGKRYVDAANVLVSTIIDRWFPFGGACPLFADAAKSLGFPMMEDCVEVGEKRYSIRRLFDLVCAAPPLDGPDRERWAGAGWKSAVGPILAAWEDLADGIDEADLQQTLGLRCPAKLERRKHGTRLVMRFVGEHDGKRYINGELELAAHEAGLHGLGDAVPERPTQSGREAIPAVPDDAATIGSIPGGQSADSVVSSWEDTSWL